MNIFNMEGTASGTLITVLDAMKKVPALTSDSKSP